MAGLASLAAGLSGYGEISRKREYVYLTPLGNQGTPEGPMVAFQYFPETLTDSKAVNWQAKEIPGGSLPLYQWTSSGERTISFTAQFSTDIDPTVQEGIIGVFTAQAYLERLKSNGVADRNVDVRSAVIWLRQFMLPTYGTSPGQTKPPSKLQLFIPRSGIGLAGGDSGISKVSDAINCVMTQCEVTWEKFFPGGYPRLASVSLSFAQIPQSGAAINFPQVSKSMTDAASAQPVEVGGVLYLGVGPMFKKEVSKSALDDAIAAASAIAGG